MAAKSKQQTEDSSRRRCRWRWWAAPAALAVVLAAFAVQQPRSPLQQQQLQADDATHQLLRGSPSAAFCAQERGPLVCAHGGDTGGRRPANSGAALRAALAGGFDCVEVDASFTADGQLVALHDRDLQRLLGQPHARVRDLTWQQLRSHAWPSGERVLTLAEALDVLGRRPNITIVDLKASLTPHQRVVLDGVELGEPEAFVAALAQLDLSADARNSSSRYLVWARDDAVVRAVVQAQLGQLAGYVVLRSAGSSLELPLRIAGAQVAAVFHGLLADDASLLPSLRGAGKLVFAWTPDAPADIGAALDLGVDAVVSNVPGLVAAARAARRARCSDAAVVRSSP